MPDEPKRTGGAVALRGLTKVYGTETVVDRFEAEIGAGEFFSLLGPSGSGKTTTLMMVAGFAEIDSGALLVDGRDLSGVPPERRGFGMVFQNYAIFPHLDVFENVAFPLRARGVARDTIRERVEWALDLVRLRHLAGRYARQLSGGQQQRVAIARAVVFHPAIVLMDEPLGALDKNLRYEMQVEIKEIQSRLGMTVLYVTHDQEEAMNLSDRIAIMNRGRIEQLGAPRDVYEHPANPFTARFFGEANLLAGTVADRSPDRTDLRLPDGRILAAARPCRLAVGQAAQLFARPEKLTLSRPAAPGGRDANRLAGRVARVSFLGSTVRYWIDLGEAGGLTVDAANHPGLYAPAAGEEVDVAWSPDDTSILGAGRMSTRRFDRPGLLLLPAILMLGLVFVVPLAWFFVRTLLVDTSPAELPAVALEVLTSRPMQIAMVTTLWISLLVTAVTLVIGYPVAFYLANRSGWRFSLVIFCVIVPYFTSVIVRTYSWMVLLGRNGIVNQLLLGSGLIEKPLPLLYNPFGIVVGMTYVLLPYMVLTLYSAMKGIDPSLMRAARALGGSGLYVFRRIYFPLTWHGVVSGGLIVLILSIGFFITPALMGGPSDVMIAMLVERAIEILLDWQSAAVMSLILLAVTLLLYVVYARVTDVQRMLSA